MQNTLGFIRKKFRVAIIPNFQVKKSEIFTFKIFKIKTSLSNMSQLSNQLS